MTLKLYNLLPHPKGQFTPCKVPFVLVTCGRRGEKNIFTKRLITCCHDVFQNLLICKSGLD